MKIGEIAKGNDPAEEKERRRRQSITFGDLEKLYLQRHAIHKKSASNDVSTGTWSLAAPMLRNRSSHSATLLPNGKVLVAGGASGSTLSSAELYDPASNGWSAAGSMATARGVGHSTTLLPDGKVLVVGGYGPGGGVYLSSAELFDPVTGTPTLASRLASTINSWCMASNGQLAVFEVAYTPTIVFVNPATGASAGSLTLSESLALDSLECIRKTPYGRRVIVPPTETVAGSARPT